MNQPLYYPGKNGHQTGREQSEQVTGDSRGPTRPVHGTGSTAWRSGSPEAGAGVLPMVAANVLYGVCPRQLQAGVDAGNRQLGNRAFMQWVGDLQADAPLQMMAKRGKKDENRKSDNNDLAMPALEAAAVELAEPVADVPDTDSDSEYEDDSDEFMANYFPSVLLLYNSLTNRAEHIQTSDHAALSLPGIGNLLASVLLGLLMIGAGLPLDICINLLGGIARCIMLLSDIFFGKPAEWLLKLYFRYYPPSAADRARSTSDELPRGPPRGIDWNVSIPELIAISGITAYWQAGVTQSSLSPRRWTQPWTGGRIASIVFRTIVFNIVYLLQFTVYPQISRRIFQNTLRWSEARSGLFVSVLNNIFDVVSIYILSNLTNSSLAIYLIFQQLIEDNGFTPSQAVAAVIGYVALGLFIQTASGATYDHFVVTRVNERNLVPWLNQFRAIPNRLVRTMAIALASFRNVIINVLSISLTTGQLSANIIGPLSTRFGQGGACFWPLAVAEVCGELPAGFNQTAQDEVIAAGEENLSFGQLFAIQMFPWLVGLLGLGIPIAYVLCRYRKVKRSGRGTNSADLVESAPEMYGELVSGEPATTRIATRPEEIVQPADAHENSPQPSLGGQSGAHPISAGLTAQMLFEWLIKRDRLTPAELTRILRNHVAGGDITEVEATLIEDMVRETVVLSKDG